MWYGQRVGEPRLHEKAHHTVGTVEGQVLQDYDALSHHDALDALGMAGQQNMLVVLCS